jgi:hypothetical protein
VSSLTTLPAHPLPSWNKDKLRNTKLVLKEWEATIIIELAEGESLSNDSKSKFV